MTIALIHKSKEVGSFSKEQADLIKNTLCKGITDDELKLFAAVCHKTGLDPFMKQIYAVKRDSKYGNSTMTIQTSIDGYRLIADRTGKYAPGRKPTFEKKDGHIISATSYVKKLTKDGTWHEVECEAMMEEYKPPITKNGYENAFWRDKPHIMLAKCAEALALRKAFPAELSGIYTEEEMYNSPNPIQTVVDVKQLDKPLNVEKPKVSQEQAEELQKLHAMCSPDFQEKMNDYLTLNKLNSYANVLAECYEKIRAKLEKRSNEYQDHLMAQFGVDTIQKVEGE